MQGAPRIHIDDEYVLDGWTVEDAPRHRTFAEDPAAARFFGWDVADARAQPDAHYVDVVRQFQRDWVNGARFSLAVRAVATGEAVGAVELCPAHDAVRVSYLVAPVLRGNGLATRGLAAFLEWAQPEFHFTRALLTCHIDNVASQRVAKKCGFTQVSRKNDDLEFVRQF